MSAPESSGTEIGDPDYWRLFNLSLDLLCVAGLDGYFKKVNPAWTRVLGWSEAELLARPVADIMHPEDRERTLAARRALAQGTLVRGLENRYLCKDGSFRWLSWQSAVELSEGKVFAVARDITAQREREREQLIWSKIESTGIFAGGIAHDFNNLLGGVLLSLDMVPLCGPANEEQRAYLRRARDAVHTAETLTRQLIVFSEGGASARAVMDLRPLLQSAFLSALQGSSIRGQTRIADDLLPAEVDESQLRQVVRAVVLNAREALGEAGSVELEAANVIAPDGAGGRRATLQIAVTDAGPGIPPDVLPKIFDPYFSTKPRGAQKGMGLSLALCRVIVRRHGGTIAVQSEYGRGTTVTIELPAHAGATA